MKGNDLMFWLSHLGDGTWDSFRNAVFELADERERAGEDFGLLVKQTRYRLSDIGCVDFLPEKRRRWQVIEPVLVSFQGTPNKAVLCGGRSPSLVAGLIQSAVPNECRVEMTQRANLPDQLIVHGEPTSVAALASTCRIARSASYPEAMIRQFTPIEFHLKEAPRAELMINWKRRFFDLERLQWTDVPISRTACECVSQFGRRMTFLQVSRTRTIALPRREAIYAAAALAGKKIVRYEATSMELRVPMHAPLPEPCARLVCVSSDNVGEFAAPMIRYSPVSPELANLIMVSLGQGHL